MFPTRAGRVDFDSSGLPRVFQPRYGMQEGYTVRPATVGVTATLQLYRHARHARLNAACGSGIDELFIRHQSHC
jgi:hypothetical protein